MKIPKLLLSLITVSVLFSNCTKNLEEAGNEIDKGISQGVTSSVAYKDEVFTEYFRRTTNGQWLASDGTISVPLPDGRKVWLMGDTYLEGYVAADTSLPCLFHVRNSILVQEAVNRNNITTILDNTKTGVNRTPVKVLDDSPTLYWPGHGYAKGDTLYTFWQEYQSSTYTFLRTSLVKMSTTNLTDASSIKSITPILAAPLMNDIEWGTFVYVDVPSNYIYIYGTKNNRLAFTFEPYVARCSYTNILGPWEYWNGLNWTSDVFQAQKISNLPASATYSVIKLQNGKFYMIVQENGFLTCGLGRNIYAYESATPYGPYTNQKLLYTIEDKYKNSYMITYNAMAHPEFTENNQLLISYNVNNICPSQCQDAFSDRINADTYRPKFIRVPLTMFDPALVAGKNKKK